MITEWRIVNSEVLDQSKLQQYYTVAKSRVKI
jgi:hypothetical protein